MHRRSSFTILAFILALAGLAFGAIFVARLPTTLTLAVGPAGLETHRYAEALAAAGVEARERIRLKIVTTSGAEASARLMDSGTVDLAIIRSDFDLPANGQSLIVNTKRAAIVMAPQRPRGGIQKFSDLKGKRIAVARLTDPNIPLVRKMLAVADIGENDATLIESELSDLPELLGNGKADAAIAVVVASAPNFTALVPEIAKRLPGGLRIVPIDEAQAIANRVTGVETLEIPAGAFGAKKPVEEITTVAITYRIVARTSMSEALAERTTRSLYDLRTRLNRTIPIAFTAEAPDAKTGARLPVHHGAMAYFDGESKTFFERYGELLFTGLWGLSIVGSGLAGLGAWLGRRKHSDAGEIIRELTDLTQRARDATTSESVSVLDARTDAIVARVSEDSHRGMIRSESLESISFALEHCRSAVESARSRLPAG
jgi:TRAP transporter TAXI family solute receptor